MLKKLVLFVIVPLVLLASYGVVNAQSKFVRSLNDVATTKAGIVEMNWFLIDDGFYGSDPMVKIEYHYFEDFSLPIGYTMLRKDDSGLWYHDETTTYNASYGQYVPSMLYVGDELTILLNNNLDYSVVFPEWQPQSLYDDNMADIVGSNRDALRQAYNQSPLNNITFLPILSD